MKKAVKARVKRLIHSRHMLRGVGIASFLESTIVPVPLEAVLLPLMQARRDRLWHIAAIATAGCLIGALFGYALGFLVFDLIGDWVIATLSSPEQWQMVTERMANEGFWFVLTLGILPIPFQIAMLAAGATEFSLFLYLLATGVSRTLRYFGIALAVHIAGDHAERVLRRYRGKAVVAIVVLVAIGWWLTRG